MKQRRRRTRAVAAGVGVVAVITLFVLGIIGLRQPEVNIAVVRITGTHYAREDLVRQVVDDALAGLYFFIIPKTSTFFYPHRAIIRDASALFPAIEKIDVRRDGFTALSVSVLERTPDALWCQTLASTSPCYFMDSAGVVFEKTDSRYESLAIYAGAIASAPLGSVFLGGAYPALRAFVDNAAAAAGRTPRSVSIDQYEDVTIRFDRGGELRFAHEDAGDALLQNIASVFASRRLLQSDEPLEYADFRFGNKIYLKFEGEE